jgi:putative Holliday junction resolvase
VSPLVGPFLGIDHGLVRIGLAISDTRGLAARELMIMSRKSKREDFDRINQIADEHRVRALVVGIPLDVERAEQGLYSQADRVRRWVESLRETTSLPIVLWDETMSSIDAQALARQKRRRVGEPIDDLAARIMLQSYLDAVRDQLAEPPV